MHTSNDPIVRSAIENDARLQGLASGLARAVAGAPHDVERPMAALAESAAFSEAILSALRARIAELRTVTR